MQSREGDGNSGSAVFPAHVAIIMDGNNRWARLRGERGVVGHRAGAEVARDIVFDCLNRGIGYLTLFAFSSENWLRPKKEVQGLMALFASVLQRTEIQVMHTHNVRLRFIGNRNSFPSRLQRLMGEVERLTADNTGMVVTVAADYGGRWDIAQAARHLAMQVEAGHLRADDITADHMQQWICMADAPDPDLCIRTGGEQRISNFLLWQFAYTEFYFTECFWPDFNSEQFQLALNDFGRRKRRFGRASGSDDNVSEHKGD